jgi:hypothetical protein
LASRYGTRLVRFEVFEVIQVAGQLAPLYAPH